MHACVAVDENKLLFQSIVPVITIGVLIMMPRTSGWEFIEFVPLFHMVSQVFSFISFILHAVPNRFHWIFNWHKLSTRRLSIVCVATHWMNNRSHIGIVRGVCVLCQLFCVHTLIHSPIGSYFYRKVYWFVRTAEIKIEIGITCAQIYSIHTTHTVFIWNCDQGCLHECGDQWLLVLVSPFQLISRSLHNDFSAWVPVCMRSPHASRECWTAV